MKKILALVLVLAIAATLFAAVPVNAVPGTFTNLFGNDEPFAFSSDAYWMGAPSSGNGVCYWTNHSEPVSNVYSVVTDTRGVPVSATTPTQDILFGNRAYKIDNGGTAAASQIFFNIHGITAGQTYTFSCWLKGYNYPGVRSACDINFQGIRAAWVDKTVDIGAVSLIQSDFNLGWRIRNELWGDDDPYLVGVADGTNGPNFDNGSFDWLQFKITFTVPATINNGVRIGTNENGDIFNNRAPTFLMIGFGNYPAGVLMIDGVSLVKGNTAPTLEQMFLNDMDGDGIVNINDTDMDGDGILNLNDNDANGDGINDATDIDVDKDGIINKYDPDIDGDGIKNIFDKDMDGDYILNIYDRSPMGCLATR